MKMYKIYDPATKLYSAGGMKNTWSKNGKMWSEAGLKGHIRCIITHLNYHPLILEIFNQYKSCVIHEFELEPVVLNIKQYLGIEE